MGKLTSFSRIERDKSFFTTGTLSGQMAGQMKSADFSHFYRIGTKPGQAAGQVIGTGWDKRDKRGPYSVRGPQLSRHFVPLSQGGAE